MKARAGWLAPVPRGTFDGLQTCRRDIVRSGSTGSDLQSMSDDRQKLDVSDLDEEDMKALAEVSKKGYYHARPLNEEAPAPTRIDMAPEAAATGKRENFDDFQ